MERAAQQGYTTRAAIRRIRELTDRPFGANKTLKLHGSMENADR